MARPLIGITADADEHTFSLRREYAARVAAAGGVPVILPALAQCAREFVERCDGLILSGGDDPIMERWGEPTHPKARPLHPDRQAFEVALLEAIDQRAQLPVLGVCLGMQLMGLHAGGKLDQHLSDHLPTAADHWGRSAHAVEGDLGSGVVLSHHRQALTDPGRLRVVARAPDGVIEAVQRDDRRFYLGVQWHPERTDDPGLGSELIRRLVEAAAAH